MYLNKDLLKVFFFNFLLGVLFKELINFTPHNWTLLLRIFMKLFN